MNANGYRGVTLRKHVRKLLEALLKADLDKACLDTALRVLQQAAQATAANAPSGKQACHALELMKKASCRVRRLPSGSDTEVRRLELEAPWTLEMTDAGVRRCLDELDNCGNLEATYRLLVAAIEGNLKYFPLGNEEKEQFYLWFHRQYQIWLEVAENSRFAGGDGPAPHPEVQIPLVLPWQRYDGAVLARFLRELVRRALGNRACMLTVIRDKDETPFVLYEYVEQGVFGTMHLFKGEQVHNVQAFLAARTLPVDYVKEIDIKHLVQIWEYERRYLREGGKGRFLHDVLGLLAEHAKLDPPPPLAQGIFTALRDIDISLDDTPAPVPALPNVEVRASRDLLRVDMGGKLNLSIADSLLFELCDALSHSRSLAAAYESCSAALALGAANRTICLAPGGLLGWLVKRIAAYRMAQAPAWLRTMTWSLKLIGSPLRMVVQIGSVGFLLTFLEGHLARVDSLRLDPKDLPQQVWQKLSSEQHRGFVHFVFTLSSASAGTSGVARLGKANARRAAYRGPVRRSRWRHRPSQSIYYPDNEIAGALLRHFEGLGLLNALDLLGQAIV
jgi:hypothetical protein